MGPKRHRWVTVQLQVRASQQNQCSTFCGSRNAGVNENQRLRQTMNGCAAVQRTFPHNPCGSHTCTWLAARLLASCGQWLVSCLSTWGQPSGFLRKMCGTFGAQIPSQRDASNSFNLLQVLDSTYSSDVTTWEKEPAFSVVARR